MNVPFVDLHAQHNEVRAELDSVFNMAIENSAFVGGAQIEAFERHFADYCGANHVVACASGTDALKLALMAVGVRPGDEVITVAHTFIATVEAITMIGAYPTFVDIDPITFNMAPLKLAAFLETNCRRRADGRLISTVTGRPISAILPVHLYGLPADMSRILDLAEMYDLKVVEDACQAHGAACVVRGVNKRAGSSGHTAAFSFYPGKNLGAMGEGGAVTTNDAAADRMMRVWRDHGQSEKYVHVTPDGWNGRLDTLQAAILDVKLQKLDEWNAARRRVAGWYSERLAADERIILPTEPAGFTHAYHLFVVRLPQRAQAQCFLSERGVATGLHYPLPLHLQAAYKDLGWRQGALPETEVVAGSILSLPMFPHLSEAQVDYVATTLMQALNER